MCPFRGPTRAVDNNSVQKVRAISYTTALRGDAVAYRVFSSCRFWTTSWRFQMLRTWWPAWLNELCLSSVLMHFFSSAEWFANESMPDWRLISLLESNEALVMDLSRLVWFATDHSSGRDRLKYYIRRLLLHGWRIIWEEPGVCHKFLVRNVEQLWTEVHVKVQPQVLQLPCCQMILNGYMQLRKGWGGRMME